MDENGQSSPPPPASCEGLHSALENLRRERQELLEEIGQLRAAVSLYAEAVRQMRAEPSA
jgi:hypothetical protein